MRKVAGMNQQQPPSCSSCIHGSTAPEQRRLSIMNDLLNEAALREMALKGGEKILDVGSGLGQLTRAMARAAGSGARVLGVERDSRQLAEAIRLARENGEENRVELRAGDALALPLRPDEWGTFDIAHARFVLEHVRDPLAVVRQMVAAVHLGGRLVLQDDDHDLLRLWPEPPGLAMVWQAYMRTYDRLGNDPYIGRRLVSLLHQAGARPVRNHWLFFGSCAGYASLEPLAENLIHILEGARETVLAQALVESSYYDATLAALRPWMQRADAAMWYPVCWAEGTRTH
jgi:ubiquinone/menaquinone biosynthesis C-methylase UbiE